MSVGVADRYPAFGGSGRGMRVRPGRVCQSDGVVHCSLTFHCTTLACACPTPHSARVSPFADVAKRVKGSSWRLEKKGTSFSLSLLPSTIAYSRVRRIQAISLIKHGSHSAQAEGGEVSVSLNLIVPLPRFCIRCIGSRSLTVRRSTCSGCCSV